MTKNAPYGPWTDELFAQAKYLAENGYSAAVIAMKLGNHLTRNSVLGKLFREHVPLAPGRNLRQTNADNGLKMKMRQRHCVASIKRTMRSRQGDPGLPVEAKPRPLPNAPVSKRLTIYELTERTCKWPIGDPDQPDFCFCGNTKEIPVSYCGYHMGIAYNTPPPRVRSL